jgi:hypothetical protein
MGKIGVVDRAGRCVIHRPEREGTGWAATSRGELIAMVVIISASLTLRGPRI